jgi:putative flippase GtrA
MNSKILEIGRYGINGVFATAIHFSVLTVNINYLQIKSAGLANFIAAIFGICISFLGNRYFVFRASANTLPNQAVRFGFLYGVIAIFHGLLLWVWADIGNFDYRYGFLLATVLQIILSYFGNKSLVFKK